MDGQEQVFPIQASFWRKCPEVRGHAIRDALFARGLAPWPKGNPPTFELTPLGGNRFRLALDPQ